MEEKSKQKQKDSDASKLQRLLSSHSLQGLVYQKRQRKQTQTINPFNQLIKKPVQAPKKKIQQIERPKNKKQIKLQKKQSKQLKNKETLPNMSRIKLKQSEKAEQKLQSSQSEKQKQQIQIIKKKGRPKKIKRQSHQQQKNQENKDNLQQNNNANTNKNTNINKNKNKNNKIITKTVEILQNQNRQQNSEQVQDNQQDQISEQQQQQSNEEIDEQYQINKNKNSKKNRKKNHKNKRKIPVKLYINRVKQQKEIQNKLDGIQQGQQQQARQQKQKQDDEQQGQQKQIKQKKKRRTNTFLGLQIPIDKIKSTPVPKRVPSQPIPQPNALPKLQYQPIPDIAQNGHRALRIRRPIVHSTSSPETPKPKSRRTKNEALKKFSLLDPQSPSYPPSPKRRKAQPYLINRIFRKTDRIQLPNSALSVDISSFSLQKFIEKLAVPFDLVHCSLPLDYIMGIQGFGSLIKKGFLFLWVRLGQIAMGYHYMDRIGFDVIDQIMWIRTNQQMNQLIVDPRNEQGKQNTTIFPNCRLTCLVGYKCSPNQKTEYCTKISNNLIFNPVPSSNSRIRMSKPPQIYQIADLMMPGARKLEIGCIRNDISGWFILEHRESSMVRCWDCLARGKRVERKGELGDSTSFGVWDGLAITNKGRIVCNECYQMDCDQQGQLKQTQKQPITWHYPLKIITKSIFSSTIHCPSCSKICFQQLSFQSCDPVCKTCFFISHPLSFFFSRNQNNENSSQIKDPIIVHNVQKVRFPKKAVRCSKCQKDVMVKFYFQCVLCKNQHNLCMACLVHEGQGIEKMDQQFKNKRSEQQQIEMQQKQIQKQQVNCLQQQKAQIKNLEPEFYPQNNNRQQQQYNKQQKLEQNQKQPKPQMQQIQQQQNLQQLLNQPQPQPQLQPQPQPQQQSPSPVSPSPCQSSSSSSPQVVPSKQNSLHQFRLKVITEFPQSRITCFQCKQQLYIPYWGCQVCQGWYSCGNCWVASNRNNNSKQTHNQQKINQQQKQQQKQKHDKNIIDQSKPDDPVPDVPNVPKKHENHCHYNSGIGRRHHLHLII